MYRSGCWKKRGEGPAPDMMAVLLLLCERVGSAGSARGRVRR